MIYVHVPFCRSFCTYCGFYSEKTSDCTESGFIQALCSETGRRKDEICVSGGPDTLYIGGGTPSVLPLSALETVVESLDKAGGRWQDEFTVEVNPDDIVEKGPEYAVGLLRLGVNRVSMGVQSLDDRILRWMNRRHDAASARKAYAVLREAGFRNISVDLISGISFMDDDAWLATIDGVLSGMGTGTAPEHISAYQLSVEPDSALSAMVDSGRYSEAAEDKCERQYRILCRRLAEAGYHHYEISNFALPGREAVHNSAYWHHLPYVGLGPAAHSLSVSPAGTGNGVIYRRSWNSPSLADYLSAYSSGDFSSVRGGETLSPEQVMIEKVMLSLRTDSGMEEPLLRECCRPGTPDAALASGALVRCPGPASPRLRIPEDRFFVSDNIIAELV